MTKEQLMASWDYELKAWIGRLGSVPVKLIASEDKSESYEMDKFHVFELEDGKFATIIESGCSCYEPSQALIELFPTEEGAMESFNEWKKQFHQ